MRSSYDKNDFGKVFENICIIHEPETIVELGVLDGYSALHFAKGLKRVGKGRLFCYDLWEDYEFNHGDFDSVYNMLKAEGVDKFVSLYKGDAYKVHENYKDEQVDVLHIDISNDGKIVRDMMELWHEKVKMLIIFEGGSKERDAVEWMVKYNKEPMVPEFAKNKLINEHYRVSNFLSFPSMTICIKKKYYNKKISGYL